MKDTETKKKRKFRFPIALKTILIFVVAGGILAEIAMIYFSIVISNSNKDRYKLLATDLSNTVALSIDTEKTKNVVNQVMSIYDEYEVKPVREEYEGTAEYDEYMARFAAVEATQDFKDVQKYLYSINEANQDADGIYLGAVDFERKLCVYIVYDQDNEYYPTGVIDPLYEEDYPLIDNHMLGFVASIYTDEVSKETLVTAGAPIVDNTGNVVCYALVDFTMNMVRAKQASSIVRLFIYLISTVVLLSAIGVVVVHFIFIKPVKTLHKATQAYDINDPEKTHKVFTELRVSVHDEITDLADSMKKMERDINDKIYELTRLNKELIASQEMTEKMTELANKDALTGVRNKIAYDKHVEELNLAIQNKEPIKFAIAMVDLNYLKNINDDFGHDSGDIALIKLSNLICTIFAHSPVFRIGGDEFIIIFKGKDYENAEKLIKEFNNKIEELSEDDELSLAEKVSAAIGYSKFNSKKDTCVDDVFKRADKAMYERKHEMKEQNQRL